MSRSIVELLEQTQIWRGQDGRVYYLGELDDEHLGAIIAMLNRRATKLLEHRRWWEEFHGHPALTDVNALEGVDATAWLHDRPLYGALLAEQRRRGAIDGDVVYPVGDVDAAERRAIRDRRHRSVPPVEVQELEDAIHERIREVAPELARVTDYEDPALEDLRVLLVRYSDAIRRLGEL